MTTRADPRFLKKLARYGNVRVEECFNCGNCTAVCPLSSEGDSFPRRMIRYAQLGMKDRLLGSRDLWMCYSCGECTQTCPRQADPAQFMAASRKYAIAKYDPLGLAKLLFTSPALSLLLMSALAVVFAGFMYTVHGPMAGDLLRLFEFIPAWIIHDLGLAVMLIVFAAGLWGVARMALRVGKADPPPRGALSTGWRPCGKPSGWRSWAKSATARTARQRPAARPGTPRSGSFTRR